MHRIALTALALGLFVVLAGYQSRSVKAEPGYLLDLPGKLEESQPRHWEVVGDVSSLNLREAPSLTSRVLAGYAPGTILDNLGCRFVADRMWCDVQQLGGGPRGFVAAEFLEPAILPDGSVAVGPDRSAERAGLGDFDARGTIPCAAAIGQPMGACDFAVARGGGGAATVIVTRPGGQTRAIFFSHGIPIGTDTSEADFGVFTAIREMDLHFVRVGTERYEIPDALINGG